MPLYVYAHHMFSPASVLSCSILRGHRGDFWRLTPSMELISAVGSLGQLSLADLVLVPSGGTGPFSPMGEITVGPGGVLGLLNSLNIHRASGPDGLSAGVLEECSSEVSPVLALVCNGSLARGAVPDGWPQAGVAPVFKRGGRYGAAGCRPVSLACICCRLANEI